MSMTRFATTIILTSLLAMGCNQALPISVEEATSPEARKAEAVPGKEAATPESLKAEIESLKPDKLAWREIQWKTCLLEAFAESRAKKKPVFLWVVGQGEGLGRT
jgi:hypothetical protein